MRARIIAVAIAAAVEAAGLATANGARALGNYPNASIPLSADTTITPDAAPTNTASILVSTSTNFKGTLEGSPETGLVRVTNAHPAGTHVITVRAFNAAGQTASRTFTLTVTTPATCNPVNFAAANLVPGTGPYSVAVGDFNGDGRQDLATANAGSNNVSIFLGDGAGNFGPHTNFAADNQPRAVAVADFNRDGKQDLALANAISENVSILLGDGAGNFNAPVSSAAGFGPVSVAIGDFNSDGKPDVATASAGAENNVWVLFGDGAGSFSSAESFDADDLPNSIAAGDFNGDARLDLAVANLNSFNVSILLGDGAGHFSAPSNFDAGSFPYALAVGDFNADGGQDLAVANSSSNCTGSVSVLLGDGAGHFSGPTNFNAGNGPRAVAVGDFNGDGRQDLAVGNACNPSRVSILLGDGGGNFSAPLNFSTGVHPLSVAVGDFTADGKQDLAVVNFTSNNVKILLRNCEPLPTPTPSPTPTPTPSPTPTPTRTCWPMITHSTSQEIVGGSQFPCVFGHVHNGQTDNSYWRAFRMQGFTGGAQYNVSAVSFGVESATDSRPVIIRLYANQGSPFPKGTRTEIGTTTVPVTQTATVITAPLVATVPAGTGELVMELFSQDAHSVPYFFFIGSNAAPQTGLSYWSAPCTGSVPIVTDMHIILNVHGSCPPSPAPTP